LDARVILVLRIEPCDVTILPLDTRARANRDIKEYIVK